MAVPSHSFRDVLTELRAYLRPWVLIVSVKGLEQGGQAIRPYGYWHLRCSNRSTLVGEETS